MVDLLQGFVRVARRKEFAVIFPRGCLLFHDNQYTNILHTGKSGEMQAGKQTQLIIVLIKD